MAVPTYKASGTFTAGTGSITPPYPTAGNAPVAGDIAILVVTSENQAISLSTANGFVEIGAQDNKAAGTAATDPASRMAVYWKRCVGSDAGPVVADSGNNQEGQIHLFSGCISTGDPWDVYYEGNDSAANDTSGSIPGGTTTVDETLLVLLCSSSYNGTSTAQFSAWTNADLDSLTERADNTNTAGLGGGHGMATGIKAIAGSVADTTLTLAQTSYKGTMSIALKPFVVTTYNGVASFSSETSLTANGTVTAASGGHADITFLELTPSSGSSVSSLSVTLPSDLQGGDFIVLRFSCNASTTLSLPTDWTRLYDGQSSSISSSIYVKYAAGSIGSASSEAATTVTVTFGISTRASAVGISMRGVDQNTAIDVTYTSTNPASGATSMTYTGVTTITEKAVLVASGSWQMAGPTAETWTQPTGFSHPMIAQTTNSGSNNSATVMAVKIQSSAGTSGDFTDSWSGASTTKTASQLFAVRPATTGVTKYNGIASFSGESSFAANGTKHFNGIASFSAQSSLTVNGTVKKVASASFLAQSSLTANGTKHFNGIASFSAQSSFTANGKRTAKGIVSFSAQSSLTTNGTVKKIASALFSSESSITTNGTKRVRGYSAFTSESTFTVVGSRKAMVIASFTAQSSLTANGTKHFNGIASFSAQSSLTANGTVKKVASASFSSQSSLTANGSRVARGIVLFSGEGIITTNSSKTIRAYATFSSGSSLTSNSMRKAVASISFSEASSFTVNGTKHIKGIITFSSQSSLTVTGKIRVPGTVSFSAQSSLIVNGTRTVFSSVSFSGTGILSTNGIYIVRGYCTLSSESSLMSNSTRIIFATTTLSSQSVISLNGIVKKVASISLSSQSSLSSYGNRKAVASISLYGQSSLTSYGRRRAIGSVQLSSQSSMQAVGIRTEVMNLGYFGILIS